ncbi:hypothetical protein GUITHDRAFT_143555 [Guillardia theta CCMP2712]|uniref:Uncharacterized protein n=1 Tax=Guillardia theta (strain CCMP2712) TaxID=905079 RepID=L1IU01_GUITC|nr:hypothetical protein GUITHDRAFT_143555 [Guillardia theta CCMP2712]EKX39354.1 hypothetical protein GUITHDRAFT_143555 [Guillardia theta CCMP2712]|eukprot:XP_005826334.1 hypothetical protein GUITHDRAFT_143555 [Guillardia theta CCMP2712]
MTVGIRCFLQGSDKSGKSARVPRCPNASDETLRAMNKEEEVAARKRKAKQMSKGKKKADGSLSSIQDSASVASSVSSQQGWTASTTCVRRDARPAEQQNRPVRNVLFSSPPVSAVELAKKIQVILQKSARGELKLSKPLSDVGKTKELCERILTSVEWLQDVMDQRDPIDPSVIQVLCGKKQTVDSSACLEETCEDLEGMDEWTPIMPVSKMLRSMIDNLNHDVEKISRDELSDNETSFDLHDILQYNQSTNVNIIQNCDEKCEKAMKDIVESIADDQYHTATDSLCDHEGATREVKDASELQSLEDELEDIICKQRQPTLKFCKSNTGGVHQYAAYVSPVLQSSAQQYNSSMMRQTPNK